MFQGKGSAKMPSPNLSGKVCLVTGSTKGIGRGIAVRLGQAGATVYVTGRTQTKIDECVAEINQRGGKVIQYCLSQYWFFHNKCQEKVEKVNMKKKILTIEINIH